MPNGPPILYDKSAMQRFSAKEAEWLTHFFITLITPVYMREVLGDLSKRSKRGTPETAVASLAKRVGDGFGNYLQVSSRSLIDGEVLGNPVSMSGRPIVAAKRVVNADGQVGAFIDESDEERILRRWGAQVFEEEERDRAALIRAEAANDDSLKTIIRNFARGRTKGAPYPGDLKETLVAVDAFLDDPGSQFRTLKSALEFFEQPPQSEAHVRRMWKAHQRPPIRLFLPYTHYCLRLILTFRYGVALGLIGQRPTNLIDLEYMLYLPFCRVFVSADRLHQDLTPFFLNSRQRFVEADNMQAGLRALTAYYQEHESELRAQGSMRFAAYPPLDMETCIHELFDEMMPKWRERAVEPKREISVDENARLVAKLKPMWEAFDKVARRD